MISLRSRAASHANSLRCLFASLGLPLLLAACVGSASGPGSPDAGDSEGGTNAGEQPVDETPDSGETDGGRESGPTPPGAVPPSGLAATEDLVGRVHLTWVAPVTDAVVTEYVVQRDGQELARVPATETVFDDTSADEAVSTAPTSVTASDQAFPSTVKVTWDAPASRNGAVHTYAVAAAYGEARSDWSSPDDGRRVLPQLKGYIVRRDGSDLSTLDADAERTYWDRSAGDGAVLTDPSLVVTQTRPDGVQLTWTVPETKPGDVHSYEVVALYDNDEQHVSESDTGASSAPSVHAIAIERDLETFYVSASTTSYFDRIAAAGLLFVTSSATWDPAEKHVRLDPIDAPEFIPNPKTVHRYRVTFMHLGGPSVSTSVEEGHPGIGEDFTYQWQRSAADSDSDYKDLPGATSLVSLDSTLPAGEARYYRLKVSGDAKFTGISFGERVAR